MTTPTAPLITHCFGRYMIAVPANFEFAHSYAHKAGDIEILRNVTPSMFDAAVNNRATMFREKTLSESYKIYYRKDALELKERKQIDPSWYQEDHPFYIDTLVITPTQKMIRYYDDGPSPYGGNIDGYVLAGKNAYRFSIGASPKVMDASTKLMADTLASVRARAPGEVPTEPGFCIDGGFIKGNENVYESVTIPMEPSDQPAVLITFNTSTPNAVDEKGLLKRQDEIAGYFSGDKDGFTALRRGKRSLNGIEGEESLTRATNDQGNVIHLFTFNAYHGSADNRRPAVDIEMSAGGPSNGTASPYTDEEAIKLWDSITNTVRLRPGAF